MMKNRKKDEEIIAKIFSLKHNLLNRENVLFENCTQIKLLFGLKIKRKTKAKATTTIE